MVASFTATEAAILAATDPKAVHNAIDDLLPDAAGQRRSLSRLDAVILRAITTLGPLVTREGKKQMVAEIRRAPRRARVRLADALTIDVEQIRKDMGEALRTVRELRHLTVSDPAILSGEPVFRRTRIPVRLIATLLERGEAPDRVAGSYPALTRRQIELAPLWARTYPARGRPPLRPWADVPPRRIQRIRLTPRS
jgi:uncharacterized protein (DUF433 family)